MNGLVGRRRRADKLVGRYVPVRFLSFALIGGVGVGVHFVVLSLMYQVVGVSFVAGHSIAALVAMVFNFALNNLITYRDRRVSGCGGSSAWLGLRRLAV